jgi:hypothetical protein
MTGTASTTKRWKWFDRPAVTNKPFYQRHLKPKSHVDEISIVDANKNQVLRILLLSVFLEGFYPAVKAAANKAFHFRLVHISEIDCEQGVLLV